MRCPLQQLKVLAYIVGGLLVGSLTVPAQTTITSVGNPKNSAVFPIEHGYINLGSGDLHLEIPIASIPQRGDLSLPATFVYDSSIWEVVNGIFGLQWAPTLPGGWSFQYDNNYGSNAAIATHACSNNPSETIYVYTAVQWTDRQGTVHTFPLKTIDTDGCSDGSYADTPTDGGFATDASGYYASLANYTELMVWDPKGTKVVSTRVPSVGASNMTSVDRNGNEIQYGLDGTVQSDSMGHALIQETVATTDGGGLPVVLYLDVPVALGQTARYTITYETVATSTSFNVPLTNFGQSQPGNVGESNASVRVIQSIGLPDGSSYSFAYSNYGEVKSMTMPHGATVTLGYTNDAGAGTTTPARWVSAHSGSDGPTSFAYVNTGAYPNSAETGGYQCSQVENTASGSKLTQTYVFSSCGGAIQPMKILLSPSSNPQVVDKFTMFGYDFTHPCQKSACTGAQSITLTGATTVLPVTGTLNSILGGTGGSGMISDIQTAYDSAGSGMVTAVKQWDYRSGTYPTSLPDAPPGNPRRETDMALGYTVNNVPFPTAVVTKDANGNPMTEVQYTYDEAAYFAGSPAGVPNHDNGQAAANRGNVTTVTRVPHGSGNAPTLTYHLMYDDTGAVVASTDAKGYVTTVAHDATDTFPTTVTQPQTHGLNGAMVSHQTTTASDFNTGQVLTATDENNQATTTQYDSIGRINSVLFSNGGQPVTLKTYSYPSLTETDASTLQVQDSYETASITTKTIVDGYGRTTQSVQNDVTAETTYNAQGQVYSVTNAHASSSSSTDGTTYYTYDELGRALSVQLPGGQSTTDTYSLNMVISTDALTHQRQRTVDVFGNIASVLEPDASGNLVWQTAYQRDDLGSLKEIDQMGGVSDTSQWRTRTFNYDGLGRLSSQTTKEAGQLSYTYDNNGNVLSVTNANSSANTVGYSYDELNRVVTKQVGGGPTYRYTYDGQDASGDPYGLGRLTSTTDGASIQTRFQHDPSGRVISEASCRPSNCSFVYKTTANFDFAGNLRALTYPDGRKIEWVYDLFNRPLEEVNSFFGADEIDVPLMVAEGYYPTGQAQDIIDGSGVEFTSVVDPNGNVGSLTYSNGSPVISRSYTWAANANNLTGVTDSASGRTQTFTYDQLDRLATATDTGTTGSATSPGLPSVPASSMSYTYDAWGNLQQSGSSGFVQLIDANNRISAVGYNYDSAGNLTSDGNGNSYTYRADGHQSASNSVSYGYDALDQRVVKSGSSTLEYFYFGGNLIATRDSGSGAWKDLLYGAHGLMAEVDGTEAAIPVYRLGDHEGTLAQTTDGNGNVVGGVTTLPFGQILSNSTADSFVFTEHEWDSENFSFNTQFRQYAPAQGRWLSPDSYAGSYDLMDPQTLNRYAYALNTPLTSTDPSGLDSCVVTGGLSFCFSSSGGSVNGDDPGDSGAAYPANGNGFNLTFIGGGTEITRMPYGGTTDPGFSERQNFQYSGPGATAQRDFNTDKQQTIIVGERALLRGWPANQFYHTYLSIPNGDGTMTTFGVLGQIENGKGTGHNQQVRAGDSRNGANPHSKRNHQYAILVSPAQLAALRQGASYWANGHTCPSCGTNYVAGPEGAYNSNTWVYNMLINNPAGRIEPPVVARPAPGWNVNDAGANYYPQ